MVIGMEGISFKISNFEGPLDLLLHLISKHKVKIYEIKISVLIDQYLEFIGNIGPDQLEPTSEFLEMAAKLVYMKSLALLPRAEETEKLKQELVGQLIEYSLCKQAAARLGDMAAGIMFAVREPLEIEFDEEYSGQHQPEQLFNAYMNTLGKNAKLVKPKVEDFDQLVTAPIVSVGSRVVKILRGIRTGTAKKIQDLFLGVETKGEAVATFLAVLELIKVGRIKISDDGDVLKGEKNREVNTIDGE